MSLRLICFVASFLLCSPLVGARAMDGPSASLDIAGAPRSTAPQSADCCLLCDRVLGADDLILVYRGRDVPLCAGECSEEFEYDPDRHLRRLSARSALFQESDQQEATPAAWFWCGAYIFLGLLSAAGCAFIAVNRGRSAPVWFFAGLFTNLLGLLAISLLSGVESGPLPAGIPSGLRKVPMTRSPTPCPYCSEDCHPSARSCASCGANLTPEIASEVDSARGNA